GEAQRTVTISKPFYLGVYEVTQEEYEKVMGANPSAWSPKRHSDIRAAGTDTRRFPVDNVSWGDANVFCRKLSELPEEKRAGRISRLPTAAEWEYACRAGTITAFYYGDSLSFKEANFSGQDPYGNAKKGPSPGRPTTVGAYKPNAWGLYD